MESQENIESKIWDYLDGRLSGVELEQVKTKISSSDEWKNTYESVFLIHSDLQNLSLQKPSLDFTASVMQKVTQQSQVKQKRSFIVGAIGLFFAVCIILLLLKAFSAGGLDREDGLWSFRGFELLPHFGRMNESGVYFFMSLNVLLLLVLVDKLLVERKASPR
jgi:hypothetical protein